MTILAALAALLAPVAPALAAQHDDYHRAVAERHAIRRVYRLERREARRAHVKLAPLRLRTWRPDRLARAHGWHGHRLRVLRHAPTWTPPRDPSDVAGAIASAAARWGFSVAGMTSVARCESTLNRFATNGQYLGLFQLGANERARYLRGDWRDAYANADAAGRYAREAGGFGPWTCGYAY